MEKQFGDLKVVHSDLGIDIYDMEGKKICFFNEAGSKGLAKFITENIPVPENTQSEGFQPKEGVTHLDLESTRKFREEIGYLINQIGSYLSARTRPMSICMTKLEEAKMWLGKHMGEVGGEDLNAKRDNDLSQK